MFKPNKALLSLSLFLLFLLVYPSLFAQEDSITMTTYYPSPYGSYREMRAKRMAVGDDYIDGATYSWDSFPTTINADADLVVEGNVGIGTTAPGAVDNTDSNVLELGIGSKARPIFRITSASQSFIMGIDDASPTKLQIQPTSGSNWLPRNSTAGITIDSTGNLGIGTTAPLRNLHINAAAAEASLVLSRADGLANNKNWRIFTNSGGAGQAPDMFIDILNDAGSAVTRSVMTILNSGNVGIGTASPGAGAKLDVAGNTILNSLQVYDRTLANGYLSISSGWDGVIRINPGTAGTMYFNRESGATKDFHVWNGVSTEVFTILGSNGNVGIGTTSPTQGKVVIYDTSASTPALYVHQAGSWEGAYISTAASTGGGRSILSLYDSNFGNRRFFFNDAGNAGADGSFSGGGADYAEYFENLNKGIIEKGSIVALEKGKLRVARKGDVFIAGVVSTFAGIVGNNGDTEEERYKYPERWTLVALMGQVQVKVKGTISHGDYIELDDNGIGRKSRQWHPDVIGQAMEDYNLKDIGKIKVLIK